MAKTFYGSIADVQAVDEFFTERGYVHRDDRAFSDARMSDLETCGLCGAVVSMSSEHRDFHHKQAELFERLERHIK